MREKGELVREGTCQDPAYLGVRHTNVTCDYFIPAGSLKFFL